MTQLAVKVKEAPAKVKATYNRNIVSDVYIITNTGLTMLVGKEGNQIRQKIEQAGKPLDYRFFDDDSKRWAYWAVKDGDVIKPPNFPSVTEYSLTSSQLYTKAITYLHILTHAVSPGVHGLCRVCQARTIHCGGRPVRGQYLGSFFRV